MKKILVSILLSTMLVGCGAANPEKANEINSIKQEITKTAGNDIVEDDIRYIAEILYQIDRVVLAEELLNSGNLTEAQEKALQSRKDFVAIKPSKEYKSFHESFVRDISAMNLKDMTKGSFKEYSQMVAIFIMVLTEDAGMTTFGF